MHALRRVQIGNALSAFGSGFTLPYMFVYVDQVRGLGSMTAWLVFTLFGLAALAVLPFTGRAVDRYGPRPVAVAASAVAALGALGFGFSTGTLPLLASAFVFGAGVTTVQPALATMIVRCSEPARRAHAFAFQFTAVNIGMGVGALAGGQIADVHHPGSLELLYTIEAAMFLVLGAVVSRVRVPAVASVRPIGGSVGSGGQWRALAGDRAMVRLLVLAAVVFFSCYGQFESGVSAYATSTVGVSPSVLGFGLGVNTLVIVVLQMGVVRLTARHRRTTAIIATSVVWLGAWAAASAAGLLRGEGAAATVGLLLTYALFGVGEALLAPTLGPVLAELAPASRLGSYNAVYALVKQVAIAIGPAAGVLLVGAGLAPVYMVAMAVTTAAIALLALRLRSALTPRQDAAPDAEPEPLPAEHRPAPALAA